MRNVAETRILEADTVCFDIVELQEKEPILQEMFGFVVKNMMD
jgi:hypothetical protein